MKKTVFLFLGLFLAFFADAQFTELVQRKDSIFLSTDGMERFVTTLKADEVYYSEPYIFFKKKKKWGALDPNGKTVISAQYQSLYYDSNNLYFVASKGKDKDGVIDTNGETVVPFEYNILIDAGLFELWGYQPVSQKGKYGIMDADFKLVCPLVYDEYLSVVVNDRVPVLTKSKGYALYDLKLQKIITGYFEEIYPMTNPDLAEYVKNKKRGIFSIGKKEMLTEAIYDEIYELTGFEKELFNVTIGEKEGLLDKNGEILLEIENSDIYPLQFKWTEGTETMVSVMTEKMGFCPIRFKNARGKFGLIDYHGIIVAEAVYDNIDYYVSPEGTFGYEKGGKKGTMKLDGTIID